MEHHGMHHLHLHRKHLHKNSITTVKFSFRLDRDITVYLTVRNHKICKI